MISNQTRDATSCRLRRHRSWRVDVAQCVAASAIALFGLRAVPADGAEQRPPFLTMEDQRRCIVQDDNCFKWIYQKALVGRIVQQVLIQRGFEQKTALFVARDWDAFRYDVETGVKILPRPPMLVTAADAAGFANRIPQCLANLTTSTCQIRFASEYGCNLQRDYAPACRRDFDGVKARFSRMPADGPFLSWFDAEYKFYNGIACIYAPNGGDIPVFDAGPAATVTKLKFDAGNEAARFTVAALAPPAPAPALPAAPAVTSAPACKAVIRAGQWRASDIFRDGQELPEQMQAPGLDGSNVTLVLRRKGVPAPAPDDQGATLARPGMPQVAYDDLQDGWLGMDLGRIEDLRAPGVTVPRVAVLYVAPNGPAAQAGIQKGDFVLRLGGRSVDDAMYLGLHTTEAPIGKPMNVVIQRDGKSSTVAITAIDIEQAGRQDDVSALRYLGDFHANLRGGDTSNTDKARRYYTRAAQLGDERAAARLAESYSGGTESDKAEARKWFEKAVAAGHAPSMLRLAAMYHDGVGGPKDPARARAVLEKGAAGGHVTLMYELVRLCQEEGAGRMPEMRTWLEKIVATPKSAIPKDGGTTVDQATFDLAVAKVDGIGGPKDETEGRWLMEKAAASGHAKRAPLLLGMLLMSGKGGPQDLVKARQWIERGTKGENADPDAMLALGRIYKDGVGVAKNPAEARKWFKKAADFGQSDAIKELGPQPKTVVATPAAPKGPVKPIPVDASLRGSFMTPRQAGPKCTPSCQDWTIIGDDLLPEASKAADADACRSLCTAAEKCVGWNFIARNGRCELKKTAVQFGLWQGEVTGIERPQLIPELQPLAKPASAPGAGAPAPSSR